MGGGKNTRPNSYYLKDASFFRPEESDFGLYAASGMDRKGEYL